MRVGHLTVLGPRKHLGRWLLGLLFRLLALLLPRFLLPGGSNFLLFGFDKCAGCSEAIDGLCDKDALKLLVLLLYAFPLRVVVVDNVGLLQAITD